MIKFGNGRGERIRTSALLLPKQALYRAKLRPDAGRMGGVIGDFVKKRKSSFPPDGEGGQID